MVRIMDKKNNNSDEVILKVEDLCMFFGKRNYVKKETQAVSARGISNAQPIEVLKPLLFAPITPMPCVTPQAATHLRQLMHLLLSRYI